MTLFKNVFRTLMKAWGQWLAIGVSIALSSAVFTMMVTSMQGIEGPTLDFLHATRQEDFSIEMLNRITPQEALRPDFSEFVETNIVTFSDIKRIDPNRYDALIKDRKTTFTDLFPTIELELRETKLLYYEFHGQKHKILLVKENQSINLTYLEAGVLPKRNDQIAINREYAKKNNLSLGDVMVLEGNPYTICGFVLLPDYTFPMFDESFNVNIALQTYAVVTDSQYESIHGKETAHFSGKFGIGQDHATFQDEVVDRYGNEASLQFITKISTTELSLRSGAIQDELVQGWAMAVGFGVFLSLISVLIVGIILYNMLHRERSQIGVLKALGYKRRRIAVPYVAAVGVLALIMLCIGYGIGMLAATPMKQLYLDFYLVPHQPLKFRWDVFLVAIFVPMSVFGAFTFLIVVRMLRTPVLDLLHPKENQSINRLSRGVGELLKKASAKRKFTWIYALQNARSFAIFFIGILFATLLINFSLAMDGMVEKLTVGNLESMRYRYESYVDFTQGIPQVTTGQEKFLNYPYGRIDQLNVLVLGIEPDAKLYSLFDARGNEITSTLRNGIVISQKLSIRKGYRIGDILDLEIGSMHHRIKIQGIHEEYTEDKVYIRRSLLSQWLSANAGEDLFTGVYSTVRPPIEGYSLVLEKDDLIDQSKSMSGFIDTVSIALIGGSALVAFCILYVLTSQTVDQNIYAISLLKVLGYTKKEVNAMILNGYLIYALVSYVISLPVAYFALQTLLNVLVVQYGITLPLQFGLNHAMTGLMFVLGIFLLGTLHSRRKIELISLQEALKAYRD